MKKIGINIIFFFLSFYNLQAQEIKGRILDENNTPVNFATVILQTRDSVFVSSVYTDDSGNFSFHENIKPFRLLIQHLLYETQDKEYVEPADIGAIKMKRKANLLQEVIVKGNRPLIEVLDGKLSYNMPLLIENKPVNNAFDALLELPGVRESDGNIMLAGANGLSIIINGKPTTMSYSQLTELLKNMPSSIIEKAEVMYVAPPQYHVRGAAINLVTGKNHFENLFGQVNLEYAQKFYDNYKTGASLFYNNSKIYADFLYSMSESKTKTGLDLLSHHLFENQIYNINQSNSGKSKYQTHQVRLGMDYKLTENDNISMVYTTQLLPKFSSLEKSSGNFSSSENNLTNSKPTQMHNVSINYAAGSGLAGGADYTHYQTGSEQFFNNNSGIGDATAFFTNSYQNIDRIKTYLDKSHQLKNNWGVGYGAEFTYAKDKSSQIYHSHTASNLSGLNTDYEQNEYTYDIYVRFSKSFSQKFSLSGTLKAEYYKLNSFSELSLFPALSSTWFSSPNHIFQFNFSTDKSYPAYWEMNGSVSYLNGYAEVHGNSNLKPCNSYSLQLSYILKSKYVATFYNIYNDNYFVQLPYQTSDRLSLIYQTTNFDYQQLTGLNLIIPFTKQLFSSRLTLNGFYYRAKNSHFHDISFDKSKYVFYAQLDNTINLLRKPDVKIDLKGFYCSNSLQGPNELSSIYKFDAGIKWTFADKKAELSLKGTDILSSWTPNLTMNYLTQNLYMQIVPDSRVISLSFVYKFGGNKTEKKRKEPDTLRFGTKYNSL
ncbi:MAG: TonB-dependent receptor [Dysgonamonadaceae bacterium]|nr:TonB-dependent receptor [Dysgonamonadaceae bacterium]